MKKLQNTLSYKIFMVLPQIRLKKIKKFFKGEINF